ncbi:MAG TPA: cyclic nucleotide-binding domain-containing protein [Fimbriimonadaceae bacterium]|nr:cyclic nucleotide-binding domain-containing protein [Fimbriimonadaceae bacterium]
MNPFLSNAYLLKGVALGDIDSIESVSETKSFNGGEVVVGIGDRSQDIMVIIEGRVRVETVNGELIDELRPGEMIGEMAFIDGKPRGANAISAGPSKIMVIPYDRLSGLMRENPKLEAIILRNAAVALCQRLRDTNQQVESLLVVR